MSDFTLPVNTTSMGGVFQLIQARAFDLATMMDTRSTAPTNFPLWSKRWNATNATFEVYSGSGWTPIVFPIAAGGLGATDVTSMRSVLGMTTPYSHTAQTSGSHGATVTPAPYAIPMATNSALLDAWISKDVGTLVFQFDGTGTVVTLGSYSEMWVPYSCWFHNYTITGDLTGNVQLKVARCTYANYNTFTTIGSASISSTKKNQAVNSGWTSLSDGDCIRVTVESCTAAQWTEITFKVQK